MELRRETLFLGYRLLDREMASRGATERPVIDCRVAPCVKSAPRLLFTAQPENISLWEQPVEGTFERAPHLRALQSRDAAGRDSRSSLAQPCDFGVPQVAHRARPGLIARLCENLTELWDRCRRCTEVHTGSFVCAAKSTPAIRAWSPNPAAVYAWGCACSHANHAPPRHDFAVLADGAHARTYLQQAAPESEIFSG